MERTQSGRLCGNAASCISHRCPLTDAMSHRREAFMAVVKASSPLHGSVTYRRPSVYVHPFVTFCCHRFTPISPLLQTTLPWMKRRLSQHEHSAFHVKREMREERLYDTTMVSEFYRSKSWNSRYFRVYVYCFKIRMGEEEILVDFSLCLYLSRKLWTLSLLVNL